MPTRRARATRTRRSPATSTSTRCSPRTTCARRCAGTTCRRSPTAPCAVVIARADKARELCDNPVWITGFAHYSELHYPGMRDLHVVAVDHARGEGRRPRGGAGRGGRAPDRVHPRGAAARRGARPRRRRRASTRRAGRSRPTRSWRPASCASPKPPRQIRDDGKHRTLAHSTSGPCLQQNLVCILEGNDR